jgi:PadR family transcriptional regulator AphA
MSDRLDRDLTTLEYVVLGLISTGPQSGYSIINTFESSVYRRWSASPGSIYPMLKRLEKADIIAGELEMVHETRPRKMYTLTPLGEELVDEWLIAPLSGYVDLVEERDITLLKFLFAENRLTREEILAWLDHFEDALTVYEKMYRIQRDPASEAWSTHQQLIIEATIMEMNMQRTWIQLARRRLQAQARQTGSE